MPPRLALSLLLCTLGAVAWATAEVEQTKLIAVDGAELASFGASVAISGDTAVISASHDDDNGMWSGSVYVYGYDGAAWVEEAKLLASDGAVHDAFGVSIAMSGERILVGAPSDDDNANLSGSAYVFRYDGTTWIEEAKLLASNASEGDSFGDTVSLSGDAAVVGAHFANGYDGSAYVFRYDGTDWVEEKRLRPSGGGPAREGQFGESVAISGDTIIVGAPFDDSTAFNSGAAYVYRYNGEKWKEEAKLGASDGAQFDLFGWSVAVSGDRFVVGAITNDRTRSGSAYVYGFDGREWVEQEKLLPSDGAPDDQFGHSVAVLGDAIAVGSQKDDDNGDWSGSVYVYGYDGTTWVEQAKLLASDGEPFDLFGWSVAMSADRFLVGAPGDDDTAYGGGSAYVYRAVPEPAAPVLVSTALLVLALLRRVRV